MNRPRRPSSSGNAGTFLALVFLLALAAGFLALVVAVMPGALAFVAVLFGFFLLGLFHYCLWGWWLAKPGATDDDADEESS